MTRLSWDAMDVQAWGVGFRGITDLEGRVIRAGQYDLRDVQGLETAHSADEFFFCQTSRSLGGRRDLPDAK